MPNADISENFHQHKPFLRTGCGDSAHTSVIRKLSIAAALIAGELDEVFPSPDLARAYDLVAAAVHELIAESGQDEARV